MGIEQISARNRNSRSLASGTEREKAGVYVRFVGEKGEVEENDGDKGKNGQAKPF
jgi:hypothetical protein